MVYSFTNKWFFLYSGKGDNMDEVLKEKELGKGVIQRINKGVLLKWKHTKASLLILWWIVMS